MKKTFLFTTLILILIFTLSTQSFAFWQDSKKVASIESDRRKADAFVKTLHITEVLGPLAPVAISPFFGLTCLSATSMLVDKGVLPANEFLMGNEVLNSPLVLAVFLALTVVTSIPKLTTGSKVLAELADGAETYAGAISYLAIFVLADFAGNSAVDNVVYTAGIFAFTKETILMAAIVANIIVINTVKFFFELLVLISPIPTLDAIFEIANKAFAAFLALVYAFNPYLALLLNIFLFLICLSIFNFCRRRVKYFRTILLGPLFYSLRKKFTSAGKLDTDKTARKKLSRIIENVNFAMKVFPKKRIGKIKKKELCYLVPRESEYLLIKPRLIRSAKIASIFKTATKAVIDKGLISNTIKLQSSDGQNHYTLMFSKSYNDRLEEIASAINS